MTVIRRDLFALVLILALAAILRLAYLGSLPLTGAEAFTWLQSQRPDWAYLGGPGGNAALMRLGLRLSGGPPGEGALRIAHALTGALAALAAYLFGLSLYSGPAGVLAAALLALGTPFVLASRHASEAAPLVTLLLLTLALLAPLWTAGHAPSPARILLGGLLAAVLANVSLAGWLLVPSLLLALAVTRPERLRQGPFWMLALVALVGLAPWVLWNRAQGAAGWHYLADSWSATPPAMQRLGALVDLAGLPVSLACVLALAELPRARNRALLVPGLVFLAAAVLWPGDPLAPLSCSLALLLGSLADSLHRWADRRFPRGQDWFPLRAIVPALVLALVGLAGYDAVVQTLAPQSALLYRAASEAIHQETAPWVGFPRVRTATWRHHLPRFEPGPWIVLEDVLAAQMAYYMDVPVYGLHAQYRQWGIPHFERALLVCGLRVDRDELTWHLRQDFAQVEGPEGRWLQAADASPYVTLWRVAGPREDSATLVERYAALRWQVLYR